MAVMSRPVEKTDSQQTLARNGLAWEHHHNSTASQTSAAYVSEGTLSEYLKGKGLMKWKTNSINQNLVQDRNVVKASSDPAHNAHTFS